MVRMPALDHAKDVLERYMPGISEEMASYPLAELEAEGNPGIGVFKRYGGPGLLVPADYGGKGATAADTLEIQFALGHLAPSTAIGVTMHQFTAATFVELLSVTSGMEWIVVEAVATQGLLVASGFAEGNPEGKVLSPTMELTADDPGFRLSGVKRPCSLSTSMDMITVSVRMPPPSEDFAIVLLAAETPGISIEPLWTNSVLAGAETGTVRFENVSVPRAALSYVSADDDLDRAQIRGYLWFELCITSAYLGLATRLVAPALERFAEVGPQVAVVGEVESCLAMLGHLASRIDAGETGRDLLARTLFVRYSVERAIQRITDQAFEELGVGPLSSDSTLTGLLVASRALSYHPPSRRRSQQGLAQYLADGDLVLE